MAVTGTTALSTVFPIILYIIFINGFLKNSIIPGVFTAQGLYIIYFILWTVSFLANWTPSKSFSWRNKTFQWTQKNLGINTRSLSDTLKILEINGIITRTVKPTVPVTVEYSLTEKWYDFERVFLKWMNGEKMAYLDL